MKASLRNARQRHHRLQLPLSCPYNRTGTVSFLHVHHNPRTSFSLMSRRRSWVGRRTAPHRVLWQQRMRCPQMPPPPRPSLVLRLSHRHLSRPAPRLHPVVMAIGVLELSIILWGRAILPLLWILNTHFIRTLFSFPSFILVSTHLLISCNPLVVLTFKLFLEMDFSKFISGVGEGG